MKIAVGFRIQDGPWGGGNRFVTNLVEALMSHGDTVVFALDDPDIDVILILDPRRRHKSVTFSVGDVLRYLLFRNPRTLAVHRINECDERKNTRRMNRLLWRANYCADYTVFVGTWLKDLPLWQNGPDARSRVITNGADARVFKSDGWRAWSGEGPLKLVTHHWGGNWMKGFDVYQRLDEMLMEPDWKGQIEFTYIGNLPKGFIFRNAAYVPPLDGEALANELRSHHAYITASINEPGGNHQNEGALCGLPLLYRRSGCLPEYCDGYGISFDESDFEMRLRQFINQYQSLAAAMRGYPHTAERTCKKYLALFDELINSRDEILASRRIWRNPWLLLRNQVPF